jgi:hypothetical protein
MDIREFNEALYASSNGVVVERRQNILLPIIILAVGVALLVLNSFIENESDANNLKSALVLVGGAILLIGVALCGVRVFGGGAPYHTKDNCCDAGCIEVVHHNAQTSSETACGTFQQK